MAEQFNYKTPKASILGLILGGIILIMIILICLLYAFKNAISFYRIPSQVKASDYNAGYSFRIGGYVANPITYTKNGKCISFMVTDNIKQIPVHYCGFIPSLFRLGQGVVLDGYFKKQINSHYIFIGNQLLTKHDEHYHPPKGAIK